MKGKYKFIPLVLTTLTVLLFACVWNNKTQDTTYPPEQLIRLHIVANSDCAVDQELKRKVRDEIIRYISPEFLEADNIYTAREIAAANLDRIKEIAAEEINAEGKDYAVDVKLDHFAFPTKHYGPFVLPAGDYESVQVVIGSGGGANWWCVLFPPLCFVDMPKETAVDLPAADLAENYNPASSLTAPESSRAKEPAPAGAAPENFAAQEPGSKASSGENQIKVEFRFRLLDLFNRLIAS